MLRRILSFAIVLSAVVSANAVFLDFESGPGALDGSWDALSDSSLITRSVDNKTPLGGNWSGRFDYTLNPSGNSYPWAGGTVLSSGVYDLRKATGVHIKLRSSADIRRLDIFFFSNWYPVIGYNYGAAYQWSFVVKSGDLDTILDMRDCKLAEWASGTSKVQVPAREDIHQGVIGLGINVRSRGIYSDSVESGTLMYDDVSLVGLDSLPQGFLPTEHVLREYDTPAIEGRFDSVAGSWHRANSKSTFSVVRDTGNAEMGSSSIRCDYTLANDSLSRRSAFGSCGIGFNGDSVFDLRQIQRLEFQYASYPSSQKMFIYPISDRYKQELLDSGIVYGWEGSRPSGSDWCPGQVLFRDSLRLPTWASSHPRLVAMVPPLDSILETTKGIEFSPKPTWVNDTSKQAYTSSGSFRVDHLVTVSATPWIKPVTSDRIEAKTPRAIRVLRIHGRTLFNDGSSDMDVFALSGRLVERIPAGSHRMLRSGSYLVRQDATTLKLPAP